MPKIHAIYEDGVFRPVEPVELPEHSEVEFEPRIVNRRSDQSESMRQIYDILSRRYATGDPYLAQRHNEHQP